MIEVGRVCVKIAGRDAGKKGVVIEVLDDHYVMVDGEVRRRKCNINHLEPLKEKVDISKNASTEDVCKALKIEVKKKVTKEKKERPKKQKKKKIVEEKKKIKKKDESK
ncbi:50S ribosomal protein L14e [archaeon]|nr:50S ribosomal protein L14e [archaeon]|tara:strand:+ start:2384 stop:2707 length:324 start_codon:yes stop_codon:yes gene_type:complete